MARRHGFTLIELMIVIAVASIILAIAVPGFQEQMAKSRRSDAIAGLGDLVLRQERYRQNNASYATMAQLAVCGTPPCDSADGHYALTVSAQSATGYTITATPKVGGSQDGDRCGVYTFTMSNGSVAKSAQDSNCSLPQ
jgi:type IV pilus assembly protein PilE